MDNTYTTKGKLLIKAPLSLESPVIIGGGEGERTDVDVLRDAASGHPLVPATSLVGVFRAYLEKSLEQIAPAEKKLKRSFIYLFGDRLTTLAQSALQCDDLVLENARIVARDGVAIDHRTNTAIDKKKYNYEIVEDNSIFLLQLEITLRHDFDAIVFKRLLWTVFVGINNGHLRLGAKTNKGFGKLRVDLNAVGIAELDFTNKQHVWQWLTGDYRYGSWDVATKKPYAISRKQFKIDAWFSIKNSLLIRSYTNDPAAPDAVALCRSGNNSRSTSTEKQVQPPTATTTATANVPILPGTSVMGAVRHRAAKILKTLGANDTLLEWSLQSLFGWVDDKQPQLRATKGRVVIEETFIRNVLAELQTRIKIDRFTGGARHGALFEMMPLWQNTGDDAVNIVVTLNGYQDWEAGLLLFILKDLWTGDLAIGGEKNVGRGVLVGHSAKITSDEEEVRLSADADGGLVYDPDKFNKLEALFCGSWRKQWQQQWQ